jgi:polyisoprenoid-binding protein YceI
MMTQTQTLTAREPAVLSGVPSGTWQIDPAHSVVGFAVRHLMGKVRGRFTEFSGSVTVPDDRRYCGVDVQIALASVATGNEMRDNHLRTDDFFGVDDHPEMTFTSTGLRHEDGSWLLDGRLAIRGTTRRVEIDVEFLGYDPTGAQGEPRIGFEGRAAINRSDFGITFGLGGSGKVVVGDRIDILLEIEAVLTD